jgi:hypothetical protein
VKIKLTYAGIWDKHKDLCLIGVLTILLYLLVMMSIDSDYKFPLKQFYEIVVCSVYLCLLVKFLVSEASYV